MKVKLKVISAICFLSIIVFNMNILIANRPSNTVNLANLISTQSANAEDIDFDHTCRCHNNICQDGNMISFRPQCAYIYPEYSTDENCQLAAPSCN